MCYSAHPKLVNSTFSAAFFVRIPLVFIYTSSNIACKGAIFSENNGIEVRIQVNAHPNWCSSDPRVGISISRNPWICRVSKRAPSF